MRVRIHATPTVKLTFARAILLSDINASLPKARYRADIVRNAIRVVNTATKTKESERWVMRNDAERMQFELYVNRIGPVAVNTENHGFTVTVDSPTKAVIKEMIGWRFGNNSEVVIVRAVEIYYKIIDGYTKGYRLGYLNAEKNVFRPITL